MHTQKNKIFQHLLLLQEAIYLFQHHSHYSRAFLELLTGHLELPFKLVYPPEMEITPLYMHETFSTKNSSGKFGHCHPPPALLHYMELFQIFGSFKQGSPPQNTTHCV